MEDPTENKKLHKYHIIQNLENIVCKNLVSNKIGGKYKYEAMMDC